MLTLPFIERIMRLGILVVIILFQLGLTEVLAQGLEKPMFKENKGQWPTRVAYQLHEGGKTIWIEPDRLTFSLADLDAHPLNQLHKLRHGEKPEQKPYIGHVYHLQFLEAKKAKIKPKGQASPTLYHYYVGNDPAQWAQDVKAYPAVVMHELYSGIRLTLKSEAGWMKYDIELEAGNTGSALKMKYSGTWGLEVKNGKLRIKTAIGQIEEHIPKAYQLDNGLARPVVCQYVLKDSVVSFHFPKGLDPRFPTVIDPVLEFFTYSGATSDNWGSTAVSDHAGNAITAGTVYGPGFPTTTGAIDRTYNGGGRHPFLSYDIGLLKFNPSGSQLVSATFLGGYGVDTPHSLNIDKDNNIFLLGTTASANFPVTSGVFQTNFKGGPVEYPNGFEQGYILPTYEDGSDLFISKISPNGRNLLASTFVGGSGTDGILNLNQPLVTNYGDQFRGDLVVDQDGSIYVASTSASGDFPIRFAAQASLRGAVDGVVFKMDAGLTQINWASYYGGSRDEALYSIQLLGDDRVVVCGGTTSSDLPVSITAYQRFLNGPDIDACLAVFQRQTGQLLASTYTGTPQYDQAYIVTEDRQSNILVFGQTKGQMPLTAGRFGQPLGGQFLQKFSPTLTTLLWGTTIGSRPFQPNISPSAMMVDSCNRIFMAGWGGRVNYSGRGFAGGFTNGLPVTADALQPVSVDSSDFYFLVLGAEAESLVYGTYFGSPGGRGEHVDGGTSRFDRNGTITQAVCGCRDGSNTYLRGTPGAYRTEIGSSNCNNGVMKINLFDLKAKFTFSGQVQCPSTLTLFNTSQNGQTYTWYFGNGDSLQSNSATVSYQYTTPGRYRITLKATNLKTCKRQAFAFDTITIPDPFPFDSLKKQADYCVGDTLRPSFPELAGYNVTWSPSLYVSNPNIAEPILVPKSSLTYTLTISNSLGCKRTANYSIKNRKIDLGIGIEKQFFPCDGVYDVRFFSNRDSSDRYVWHFGPGDTAVGPSVIRRYENNGTFPIRLNGAKLGCEENALDTLKLSDQKITIAPAFTYGIKYEGCEQPRYYLKNLSLNGQSFLWHFGDGSTSTEVDPTHTFSEPGTYKVQLEAYHKSCKELVEKEIKVDKFFIPSLITRNKDQKNEAFEIKGLQPGWKVEIFNRWGKQLFETENYQNNWVPDQNQEGVYFYNIIFPEGKHCNGWMQVMKD